MKGKCRIPGCDNPIAAHGRCIAHLHPNGCPCSLCEGKVEDPHSPSAAANNAYYNKADRITDRIEARERRIEERAQLIVGRERVHQLGIAQRAKERAKQSRLLAMEKCADLIEWWDGEEDRKEARKQATRWLNWLRKLAKDIEREKKRRKRAAARERKKAREAIKKAERATYIGEVRAERRRVKEARIANEKRTKTCRYPGCNKPVKQFYGTVCEEHAHTEYCSCPYCLENKLL